MNVYRSIDLLKKTLFVCLRYPWVLSTRPRRVTRSVKIFFRYGLRSMMQDAYDFLIFEEIQRTRLSFDPVCVRVIMPPLQEPIIFPVFQNPLVSIVVCCFEQWSSTLLCLNALRAHTENVPYEVIVVDDGSNDETPSELLLVQNVFVIRHEKSQGYLKSANEGASHARGTYIVQLNNDTIPQPDWLAPLVDTFKRRLNAVIAGPMFLWPNGSIQEAGGRIFSDGRAAQFGNGEMSLTSEYRYSRPVDYVSGAALCVKKSFWDSVGGYDERFAPAYYEDTDLALTAISQGYEVMYQPLSKIAHWSHTSYGIDGLFRMESLINERRDIFVKKWSELLPSFSTTNQLRTMGVENRHSAPVILVIDYHVPRPEEDAGSKCTSQYLTLLISLGCIVKFVPWKYGCPDVFDTSLASLGVELIHPMSLSAWIKLHGRNVHTILFFRSSVMADLAAELRPDTSARFILCVADMESLRESRNPNSLYRESVRALSDEQEAFRWAQGIATHSIVERDLIRSHVSSSTLVTIIPNHVIYNSQKKLFKHKRDSILFVGGFLHGPNRDALMWLADEVASHIHAHLPDVHIIVAGSYIPTSLVTRASCLEFVHHPSEEKLAQLYEQSHVSIAPLRYGAGAKGKIVESLAYGVPVVTTPIGAEGFYGHVPCLVGKNAEELALHILSLFHDESLYEKLSCDGLTYIEKYFSPPAALSALRKLIPELPERISLFSHESISSHVKSVQKDGPLFSIVMPVWRPETRHFREALESIFRQKYTQWEMCIAYSEISEEARDVISAAQQRSPRILVVELTKNLGISENTNKAISQATGDYIVFMDQDDLLDPLALDRLAHALEEKDADLLYTDEIVSHDNGRIRQVAQKPGWSPEMLRSVNYVSHLVAVRSSLLRQVGGLRSEYDGAQDHDFLLRVRPLCHCVVHIPLPLYLWRAHKNSTSFTVSAKPYALKSVLRAVTEELKRSEERATVTLHSDTSCRVDIRYSVSEHPKVDIVIVSRDESLLRPCLESIFSLTKYDSYSVTVVNHNHTPAIHRYLSRCFPDTVKEVVRDGDFNFSAFVNYGATFGNGEQILFLNDDIRIIDPHWLLALVEQGVRPHVGAVGAKLWYPDGRIQHFGVLMGQGPETIALNAYRGTPPQTAKDLHTAQIVREFLAVTGACLLTKRDAWERVGGFEERLSVAFNDVDFCLRLREQGYSVLATPYAQMIHHESATRPMGAPKADADYMRKHWKKYIAYDPFSSSDATIFAHFPDADSRS